MNPKIQGIVLDLQEYRDQDAIVSILCQEKGVQRFVVRGIQKIKSPHAAILQPFAVVVVDAYIKPQKQLHALRRAELQKSFQDIRDDLLKQAIASVCCECMRKAEWNEKEDAFTFFLHFLECLSKSIAPYLLFGLFLSQMNRMHGIEPYVDGCVRCQNTRHIADISLRYGGFVCLYCASVSTYTKEQLRQFRILCKASLKHYETLQEHGQWDPVIIDLLAAFFQEYSGIHLQSIRFLKHLQDLGGTL